MRGGIQVIGYAARIFIGQIGAEGMDVFPAPNRDVALIHDHSRRVEVVGMNEINLDRAGRGGFSDHGHWNIYLTRWFPV